VYNLTVSPAADVGFLGTTVPPGPGTQIASDLFVEFKVANKGPALVSDLLVFVELDPKVVPRTIPASCNATVFQSCDNSVPEPCSKYDGHTYTCLVESIKKQANMKLVFGVYVPEASGTAVYRAWSDYPYDTLDDNNDVVIERPLVDYADLILSTSDSQDS